MEKATKNLQGEWFRNWFDENYQLVYSHRTDAEAESFVNHWRLDWRSLNGKRALDLGCGNGRFSRAISSRGVNVVGVDLSRDQLTLAAGSPASVQSLIRADMRQLPLKSGFSLIVSLFTSFGYFETDIEHERVLNDLVSLLLPSGVIVMDLPCRDSAMREVKANPLSVREINGVRVTECRRLTMENSRFEKEITLESDGQVSKYRESVRLFSADELLKMTQRACLTQIEPLWGDYSGGEMSETKSRMVYFGRKNG